MGKVIGNPTTTPINIQNFKGKASAINNKASGKGIHITDSSESSLNNLIIYGKTTQAAEPTLEAPQELVSVGAEPFNVYVTGNNLFKPYAISCSSLEWGDRKPSTSQATTKNDWGVKINSISYNNEIGIIATQEDTQTDGVTPAKSDGINGFFYMYFNTSAYYNYNDWYTFIADVEVLENKHPEQSMNLLLRGTTLPNTSVNLKGNKDRIVARVKATSVEDVPHRRRIEMVTYGKSLSLKNIMWLPGDWTANPPEYEDYKEQVLSVEAKSTTGNAENRAGLVAVPVESGGNYTDETGQHWVANTLDFANGKHNKRVLGRIILPTGWYVSENQLSTDGNITYCRYFDSWNYGGFSNVLSNYFPYKIEPTTGQGIWISDAGDGKCILNITTSIPSVEELESFISTNRPYVYYMPGTNIPASLSDEEIAAYQSLKTNYPITRVVNDVDAGMEVEYVADTKNYIDNKFAELTALTLEG